MQFRGHKSKSFELEQLRVEPGLYFSWPLQYPRLLWQLFRDMFHKLRRLDVQGLIPF